MLNADAHVLDAPWGLRNIVILVIYVDAHVLDAPWGLRNIVISMKVTETCRDEFLSTEEYFLSTTLCTTMYCLFLTPTRILLIVVICSTNSYVKMIQSFDLLIF